MKCCIYNGCIECSKKNSCEDLFKWLKKRPNSPAWKILFLKLRNTLPKEIFKIGKGEQR